MAVQYNLLGVESHWWMESINVVGVLQEADDANLRAHTRFQVQVEYFIISYPSTFIIYSLLLQMIYIKVSVGTGGGCHFIVFCFAPALLSFVLSCPQLLYLGVFVSGPFE